MSYIVDAARRQQQDTMPASAAESAMQRAYTRERRLRWLTGTLAAVGLLVTSAMVARWYLPPDESAPSVTTVPSTTTVPPSGTGFPPGGSMAPGTNTPAAADSEVPYYQPLERSETSEHELPSAITIRSKVSLQNAPDAVQHELLAFNYSSHLFTSIPAKRSLSVNGKRLHEGDMVGEWALSEITERGAIWDNGDVLVEVPVLDLWD
jgi:general secretion pathway protein B